jgi:hypothetical protein
MTFEDLEVNQLLWSVLETLRGSPADGDEVIFDPTLTTWRLSSPMTTHVDDAGKIVRIFLSDRVKLLDID